jgi:hypothetical protein
MTGKYIIHAQCEEGTIYYTHWSWSDSKSDAKLFDSYDRAKLILNRLLSRRGLVSNPWWFDAAIIEVDQ